MVLMPVVVADDRHFFVFDLFHIDRKAFSVEGNSCFIEFVCTQVDITVSLPMKS